jgi:hypothetical protein
MDWLHPPKPLIVAESGGGLGGLTCEDNPVSWALYADGHLFLIPYATGCRYRVLQLSNSELRALTAALDPVALEKARTLELQPGVVVADAGWQKLFIWWKGALHVVEVGANDRAGERIHQAMKPYLSRPASVSSLWVPPYLLADLRGPNSAVFGPREKAKPWPADWPMPERPRDPSTCENLGVWLPGSKMEDLLKGGFFRLYGCTYWLFVYIPLPGQSAWPDEIRMLGS